MSEFKERFLEAPGVVREATVHDAVYLRTLTEAIEAAADDDPGEDGEQLTTCDRCWRFPCRCPMVDFEHPGRVARPHSRE